MGLLQQVARPPASVLVSPNRYLLISVRRILHRLFAHPAKLDTRLQASNQSEHSAFAYPAPHQLDINYLVIVDIEVGLIAKCI